MIFPRHTGLAVSTGSDGVGHRRLTCGLSIERILTEPERPGKCAAEGTHVISSGSLSELMGLCRGESKADFPLASPQTMKA